MKTVTFDPEQWQLVPIIATDIMLNAPVRHSKALLPHAQRRWQIMLATAPQHESQWQPDTSPDLESRDFYEVMQAYRHSLMEKPADVVAAFEAVKAWIRNPTYPYKHPDTIKIPRPEGHDSWSIEIKTSYGGGGGGGSNPDTGETTSQTVAD